MIHETRAPDQQHETETYTTTVAVPRQPASGTRSSLETAWCCESLVLQICLGETLIKQLENTKFKHNHQLHKET